METDLITQLETYLSRNPDFDLVIEETMLGSNPDGGFSFGSRIFPAMLRPDGSPVRCPKMFSDMRPPVFARAVFEAATAEFDPKEPCVALINAPGGTRINAQWIPETRWDKYRENSTILILSALPDLNPEERAIS